ncbi:MAG: hypothetical protein ACK559_33400, partial [bacterium]
TVPTTSEPKRRKTCTAPPPTPASTQINSTGPTLHTAEPHTEGKYDPARQRNPQGLSTPKIKQNKRQA